MNAMKKRKVEDSHGVIMCACVCVQGGTQEESESLHFSAAPGWVRKPGIAPVHRVGRGTSAAGVVLSPQKGCGCQSGHMVTSTKCRKGQILKPQVT